MSDRWAQLEELFHDALQYQGEAQLRFVQQSCQDENMRAELLALLSAQAKTSLEAAVLNSVQSVLDGSVAQRQVGPYRILRQIGAGGMGSVYLAERTDFHQQVAIKFIHPGLSHSSEILTRFRSERQILAKLNHPHIARLLDGGVTEANTPYFVIEYVEGVPLDRYVQSHQLSLRDRLKLFQTICVAVSYAHRNLVIHRDLKPANILVTSDGTPKLLDFGIAKLLGEEEAAPWTVPLTSIGGGLLTPEYASPEQIRAQTVTTASDVYSLGVILYEVLAGCKPYRLRDLSPTMLESTVCEINPTKLSQAAATQQVSYARQLKGDLDLVVARAMAKDVERRYATADALQQEIGRYLEGFPIEAKPESSLYILNRFVHRHRTAVALTVALAIVLLAFTVNLVFSVKRLAAQRDELNRERLQSEQVTGFLVDLFQVSDPSQSQGTTITAREMLDRGSEKIEHALANQPQIRVRMLDTLGKVYAGLGFYDRAVSLNESALRARKLLNGPDSESVATGELNLAAELFRKDQDYPRVEQLARDALRIRQKHSGPQSVAVAEPTQILGNLERMKGNWSRSETLLRQAYTTFSQSRGLNSLATAKAAYDLARIIYQKGDSAAAEPLFRQALATRQKLLSPNNSLIIDSQESVGMTLQAEGKLDEAELYLRRVLQGRQHIYSPGHPGIAVARSNLAGLYQDEGKFSLAEQLYREALASKRATGGDNSFDRAATLNDLGDLLREEERWGEAEAAFREAAATFAGKLGPQHPFTLGAQDALALCLLHETRLAEADRVESEVVAQSTAGPDSSRKILIRSQTHLGQIRAAHGSNAEAARLLTQSHQLALATNPPSKSLEALTSSALGEFLLQQSQFARAEPLLKRAWDIRSSAAPDSLSAASAESSWGSCLLSLHRPAEAKPHLAHAYRVYLAKRGAASPDTAKLKSLLSAAG